MRLCLAVIALLAGTLPAEAQQRVRIATYNIRWLSSKNTMCGDVRVYDVRGARDRRLGVARIGLAPAADGKRGHAVGQEEDDLARRRARLTPRPGQAGELGDPQPHARREVGRPARAARHHAGEGALHAVEVDVQDVLAVGVVLDLPDQHPLGSTKQRLEGRHPLHHHKYDKRCPTQQQEHGKVLVLSK